jgi:hypothetical protein
MQQWTNIQPVALEDWFTDDTRAKAAAFNKEIVELLEGRTALDQDRQAFRNAAAELGGKALKRRQDLRARELDLLSAEVTIRERLDAFDRRRVDDRSAARDKAFNALEKAKAATRTALVKLGYHNVDPTAQDPSKITPGMILAHPSVVAASRQHETLYNQSLDTNVFRQDNEAALARVREALATACQ